MYDFLGFQCIARNDKFTAKPAEKLGVFAHDDLFKRLLYSPEMAQVKTYSIRRRAAVVEIDRVEKSLVVEQTWVRRIYQLPHPLGLRPRQASRQRAYKMHRVPCL